jgi:D-threonine aldolase
MTLDIAWARAADLSAIPSPALLLGLEPIERNLQTMLAIAGSPARLRPHVKTHKLGWLVQRQIALGINSFKCATIAEAEMCAQAGAPDILIAFQLVGPNIARLLALREKFPGTKFSTVVDDSGALHALADAAKKSGARLEVLVDLDVGQHRTGIAPGPAAVALYRELAAAPSLMPGGLHAYDGHLSQSNPATRAAACAEAFAPVAAMREELLALGLPVPRVVAGGTPTFPMHAARGNVQCSPGHLCAVGRLLRGQTGRPGFQTGCRAVDTNREQTRRKPALPRFGPQGGRVGNAASARGFSRFARRPVHHAQ